jgi:hypothetical protein
MRSRSAELLKPISARSRSDGRFRESASREKIFARRFQEEIPNHRIAGC